MIRRPPRSTLDRSSAASDVYKRQVQYHQVLHGGVSGRNSHHRQRHHSPQGTRDRPEGPGPVAVSKARRKEVAGAPPPSPSREPVRRALLVLITLLLRLPFIARFDFVSFDGTYYLSQAKALLHGSLSGGAFPLGYPLLIAPVLAVLRDPV